MTQFKLPDARTASSPSYAHGRQADLSRSRKRRYLAVAATVVLLILLGVHYAPMMNGPQVATSVQKDASAPGSNSAQNPDSVVAAGCVDETDSTAADFHQAILTAIETRLAHWYPEATIDGGEPATPALTLAVFPVTAASTDFNVQAFRVTLPALNALPKMPETGDVTDWLIEKQHWSEELEKDTALAREAEAALKSYQFAQPDSSGIGTCLSAVALDLGDRSNARVAMFSDLVNNETVQTAGSLRSASVWVAQPCNTDLATCQQNFADFSALASSMGAASVTSTNPKNPTQAVTAWLGR